MIADEITATVLDYFEGWFDGDAARMRRALHPGLAKRALLDDGSTLDETSAEWMNEATASELGKRRYPGKHEIDVRVVDVLEPIASVVVESDVYREYLHLVRTPDGWKIVNALWRFS